MMFRQTIAIYDKPGKTIALCHLLYSKPSQIISAWWFGTFFPYIGNVIIPSDELHHFSKG